VGNVEPTLEEKKFWELATSSPRVDLYLNVLQKPQGRPPEDDYPIGAFLQDRPLPAKYKGIAEAREGDDRENSRRS
jgi:hypothetical protein